MVIKLYFCLYSESSTNFLFLITINEKNNAKTIHINNTKIPIITDISVIEYPLNMTSLKASDGRVAGKRYEKYRKYTGCPSNGHDAPHKLDII